MTPSPYLEVHGFSICELTNNKGAKTGEFRINQKNFSGSLQNCVDLACDSFAQKNRMAGMLTKGFAQCPSSSERFLSLHGVSVNVKKEWRGNVSGYFVSNHEEDLSSLQGAVDTACGLFCIQYGIIDKEGDPILKAPKATRKPGGYDIEGADNLLDTDEDIIQLFTGED